MQELENLLNEYINEDISFLVYRERRAQYINEFVSSGLLPDDTIPLSTTDQYKIQNAVLEEVRNSSLDTSKLSVGSSGGIAAKQYLMLGVLILIAALAWYYSTQMETQQPTQSNNQNSVSPIEKQDTAPEKISPTKNNSDKAFIIHFVNRDKWDSDSLSEFLVKWQKLSRLEKKKVKQSQSFIRLKNSLRLRILEQKALQSGENKEAQRQENLLNWFATELSINIS